MCILWLEKEWFCEPASKPVIREVNERAAYYNFDHLLLRLRPYSVSGTVFCRLYYLNLIIIYEKLTHYIHEKTKFSKYFLSYLHGK